MTNAKNIKKGVRMKLNNLSKCGYIDYPANEPSQNEVIKSMLGIDKSSDEEKLAMFGVTDEKKLTFNVEEDEEKRAMLGLNNKTEAIKGMII